MSTSRTEPGAAASLAASLPLAAVVVDDGVVVAANPSAEGLVPGLVRGAALTDALVAEAPDPWTALRAGRPVRARATDDPVRIVELRASPVAPAAGLSGGHLVVLVDRTEEARLAATLDATADGTYLLDEGGTVTWQSPAFAARWPDAGGGVGSNPLAFVHPEDLPDVLDAWVRAIEEPDRILRYEMRTRAPEEEHVWRQAEVSGRSRLTDPLLRSLVVQIRYLGDDQLLESVGRAEGQFHSLADAAPIGIVVIDAWGRTVFRNAVARELLDQAEEEDGEGEEEGGDGWIALARPEHRDDLRRAVGRATYRGRTTVETAAFDRPDGAVRWLRVRITPRMIEGRQAVGLIITLEDVTPEMLARAQTERLTQMLDATSDYVAVFRTDGEVLYVNSATRRLLEEQKRAGRHGRLSDLVLDDDREQIVRDALAALDVDDVWEGELTLRDGDGNPIPTSAIAVARRGPDGGLDWVAIHARDITALKEAQHQLRQAATHDHLTLLPNRPLFNDRLGQAVARHRRERRGVAVLFCDLDDFKPINDEYGHAAGDAVLRAVAERIHDVTRETDTAARVGGDEFVIVCEAVTDSDELAEIAERVIEQVTAPIALPDGREVSVGISVGVGVARSRQGDVDEDRLLSLADSAMYRAKARGGRTFRVAALDD